MDMQDKEQIMDAFGEDISIRRIGNSTTTEYISKQQPLRPRDSTTPKDISTGERVMRMAIGEGIRIYDSPLQMAISAQGFEEWCISKNVAPSFAGLSYYLGISKNTLIKYLSDTTEYLCYSIRDTVTGEYIYSTNDRRKLDIYIERNSIVDIDKDTGEALEDTVSNISTGKSKSLQERIDDGEYEIVTATTTFADTLNPIKNLLEIVNIDKAEKAKNAGWYIFLSKNNFGATTHYTDEQKMVIEPHNPIDELDDSAILRLAHGLTDDV